MTFKLEAPPKPLDKLPEIKSVVYIWEKLPSGNYKFTSGTVLDCSVRPIAVKVRYVAAGERLKSGWFRFDQLTASCPVK